MEGDRELLGEMAELFLGECTKLLSEIKTALFHKDPKALHHSAHTLKGAVGNFAAHRAFDAAFTLEKMGRQEDLSHAPEALATLEQELARLTSALSSLTTKVAA